MANQRIQMFQVKRIIEPRASKKSNRFIFRILGMISRNTLNNYLKRLLSHNPDLSSFSSRTEEQLDKLIPVEFFVARLLCSQLNYVQCVMSQRTEYCAGSPVYPGPEQPTYGGVPQAFVPDNLKAAVTKADRYNRLMRQDLTTKIAMGAFRKCSQYPRLGYYKYLFNNSISQTY